MAVTALAVQQAARTGALLTKSTVTTGGFTFPNDGHTLLIVQNDSGALALVFDTPGTVDGLAIAQRTVTVATLEQWVIGPFPTAIYNNAQDLVTVTPDKGLTSAVAVVRV